MSRKQKITLHFSSDKSAPLFMKSVKLRAKVLSDEYIRITDKEAATLTPASTQIDKNVYLKVKKIEDGIYEYVDSCVDPALTGSLISNHTPFFGEGFLIKSMMIVAGSLFCISVAVHFSTYFVSGMFFSTMDHLWPLHILIFPPFITAILLAKKWGSSNDDESGQDRVDRHAPNWLTALAGACFAYAIVNFIIFTRLLHERLFQLSMAVFSLCYMSAAMKTPFFS